MEQEWVFKDENSTYIDRGKSLGLWTKKMENRNFSAIVLTLIYQWQKYNR